ncbi:unnamed protein product, partial [Urochloa humidicola]
ASSYCGGGPQRDAGPSRDDGHHRPTRDDLTVLWCTDYTVQK